MQDCFSATMIYIVGGGGLNLKKVGEAICDFAYTHERRLRVHINVEAQQLPNATKRGFIDKTIIYIFNLN